ncbi:MAG: hypothetical protein HYX90_02820 [Chloroflexi bacterium]|nr:hypothetical protein [Chloroflexota bacterium]
MKELPVSQKAKVVKLFLGGYTYDEIALQVGIAKGSVVNVIDEFRDGEIPIPAVMAEYVDALRHLVVDMKKHDCSTGQLKGCLKLYPALKKMGVDVEEAEQWLEACHTIASPASSGGQLVNAALELAKAESSSGVTYSETIADYHAKVDQVKLLDEEIKCRKADVGQLKLDYANTKWKATQVLDGINKAIGTARKMWGKQKDSLNTKLNQFMAQHKLSWGRVNTAFAILDSAGGQSGLSKHDIEVLAGNIRQAASLHQHMSELESEQARLTDSVAQLKELEVRVFDLLQIHSRLIISNANDMQEHTTLTRRLGQLRQTVSDNLDMVNIAHLIMGALLSPNLLNNDDIDELTRLMIYVRQHRLGIDRKSVKFVDGEAICECRVPKPYFEPGDHDLGPKEGEVFKKLALTLVPLVKDDFMPRWEWQSEQLAQLLIKQKDLCDAVSALGN